MYVLTAIYCLLMALLIYRRAQMRDADLDFHSAAIAQAVGMMAMEGMMKFFSILYGISVLLAVLF